MLSDWNRRGNHFELIDDDHSIWLSSAKIVHRHLCIPNRIGHLPALASLRGREEWSVINVLSLRKILLAFEADFWLSIDTILSASFVPAPSEARSGDNFARLPLIDGTCCDEIFFVRCPVVIESDDLTESPLPIGEFSPGSLVGVVNVEEKWSKRTKASDPSMNVERKKDVKCFVCGEGTSRQHWSRGCSPSHQYLHSIWIHVTRWNDRIK